MPRRAAQAAKRDRNARGQGDLLRAELIDAAIDLLAELGDFEAMSVRAVTARAGVTPTALYLHFDDKEQLLEAVKHRCFAELRRYVLAAEEGAGSHARDQAEAMCMAYLRFADDRPGHYRVLFQTSRSSLATGHGHQSSSQWPPAAVDAFGDLVRAVTRCLTDGRDPFEIAGLVWAGLHGFIGLRASSHFPFAASDRYVQLLLDSHFDSGLSETASE